MVNALWAVLGAAAILWPARLVGPLDGIPLDSPFEAAVLGFALIFLIVLEPRVLRRALFRATVVALLLWKAGTSAALVQDGWCVQFTTPSPVYLDMGLVPHAWDIRADWRAAEPRCSAVMTRAYPSIDRFPVWFYNLPPALDGEAAGVNDRPPHVTLKMAVDGFLQPSREGVLQMAVGHDMRMTARIDDAEVAAEQLEGGVRVSPGPHTISLRADLSGDRWTLVPTWDGGDLWRGSTATLSPPSTLDAWLRPWGRYLPLALILLLLFDGLVAIVQRANSPAALGFAVAMSAVAAMLAVGQQTSLVRAAPLLLLPAAFIAWPRRLQGLFGAQLLIGVPFMVMVAAMAVPHAGVVTWYTSGDDWWIFQRYAYRIFLEGFWLEGGQRTFWFQPLYRWIAGSLHMVFGDSSIGELLWDGGCVMAGAMFTFATTRAFAGFRWGVLAAVATLAMFTLGPGWYLIGRGLSEISSMGFIYAAALLVWRGRHGHLPAIVAGGICATLAIYTRLNNLPIAFAVVAFAWPAAYPIDRLWTPAAWWPQLSRKAAFGVIAVLVVGLLLFAARTWHYTGVFSLLYGTQGSARSIWKTTDEGFTPLDQLTRSVLMVLSMNDPPRLDVRAVPIVIGVLVSLLGVCRIRPFTRLPFALVALCLAGMSGALVAVGTAYPGRFSVHLIPVAVALTFCALSFVPSLFMPRSHDHKS